MLTTFVGIVGLVGGIFLGEKLCMKLIERRLLRQGWSPEAIKKKVFGKKMKI